MSVKFEESETLKNLMRAFAGESQARNRYTFAAALCKQQKLQVVETVFRFTAGQEQEHAEIFYHHMAQLEAATVTIDGGYPASGANSALKLLREAQHNEEEEQNVIYKSFGETARAEGFLPVAASFEQIAQIEGTHGQRFGFLADLLEQDRLFVSDVECGWMCLNCGHIFHGLAAPKLCPVCSHDQGFFIRLELAPYGGASVLM